MGDTRNHDVIICNGPPSSGKDTIANMIRRSYLCRHLRFSEPLKRTALSMFGLTCDWKYLDTHYKEKPCPKLFNMTFRQFQIWLSEEVMKPKFGKEVFGEIALRKLEEPTNTRFSIFSDGGFIDEARPLLRHFGKRRVHIFHIAREGCSYTGDSRGYLYPTHAGEIAQPTIICNNFALDKLQTLVYNVVTNVWGLGPPNSNVSYSLDALDDSFITSHATQARAVRSTWVSST